MEYLDLFDIDNPNGVDATPKPTKTPPNDVTATPNTDDKAMASVEEDVDDAPMSQTADTDDYMVADYSADAPQDIAAWSLWSNK